MRSVSLGLSLLAFFAASAHAQAPAPAAEVVGVFPVQGTNLSAGEAEAIGALIAVSYSAGGQDRVLDPSVTGPALAQHGSKPDTARALGLTQYVEVRAVRLSQRVTLHATLHNVHGSQLYEVKTTAMSMDDMEEVSDRMASSLRRRTPMEHTRTLDNVTAKEARAPNRTFSEKVMGIRTAVVFPFAPDMSPSAALVAQFDGRLEGRTYFLEFAGGFMLPSDFESDDTEAIGGLVGLLGGAYYLTSTDVSPYVGGGLSPRIMFGAYSGGAVAVHGKLGLMFMRHSSSRLYAEVGVDQHLLPLSPDYDYYYDGTGVVMNDAADDVWPTELSLAVGIGW